MNVTDLLKRIYNKAELTPFLQRYKPGFRLKWYTWNGRSSINWMAVNASVCAAVALRGKGWHRIHSTCCMSTVEQVLGGAVAQQLNVHSILVYTLYTLFNHLFPQHPICMIIFISCCIVTNSSCTKRWRSLCLAVVCCASLWFLPCANWCKINGVARSRERGSVWEVSISRKKDYHGLELDAFVHLMFSMYIRE